MEYASQNSTSVVAQPEPSPPSGLLASRAKAVQHIFRGGVTSLVGLIALGGGIVTEHTLSWALGLGGLAIAGTGLITLGRAALHFRRYGSDRGALILVGGIGLGASLVVWGASALPAALGVFPFLARFTSGPRSLCWDSAFLSSY